MNIDCLTLENNIDYVIIDTIDNYIYLANINDSKDICIRKSIIENGEEFIVGLDNDEEFDKALKLFENKNKK